MQFRTSHETCMKIANLFFPSVDWISVNVMVAREQTWVRQGKTSHAQSTGTPPAWLNLWFSHLAGPQNTKRPGRQCRLPGSLIPELVFLTSATTGTAKAGSLNSKPTMG